MVESSENLTTIVSRWRPVNSTNGESRNFKRGETIYQPHCHVSQMHTTSYNPIIDPRILAGTASDVCWRRHTLYWSIWRTRDRYAVQIDLLTYTGKVGLLE